VIVCTSVADPEIFFRIPLVIGLYWKNRPPSPRGGRKIPDDVIWGKKYEKVKRKRGKCKEKGRKGKKGRKEKE
jgi:hypothetical protein